MHDICEFLTKHQIKIVFLSGLLSRLFAFWFIPIDWNSDSYHHWLISYLTLHIGFSNRRIWDLLGCDYYWGIIPHIIYAFLLWVFRTSHLEIIRLFNVLVGAFNALLVYKVSLLYYNENAALISGLSFAVFPLSAIFDSIGMQDSIALCFFLASLYTMKTRYFWSGFLLGLACHSRVEYTLISIIILAGFILRERLDPDSQPYILGWVTGWGIPTIHIYFQTGNPIYPLYYSLYSVFGGYTSKLKGLPFKDVMFGWLGSRLQIWGASFFGLLVILVGVIGIYLFFSMVWKNWSSFQPLLYFTSASMILGPLFLPYFEKDRLFLLMMIRFVNPLVALGLPIVFNLIMNVRGFYGNILRYFRIGFLLFLLLIYPSIAVEYRNLQGLIIDEFAEADKIGNIYAGGTIICDIPSMVYRLVIEYDIKPRCVLSNLYNPHYFGIYDPICYLEWIERNDIQFWTYYDERGDVVWDIFERNYPDLLINISGIPREGFYMVNRTLLDSIL